VDIRILGAIKVVDDGSPVILSPQLTRLLALLIVADGATVSADAIAEHVTDSDLAGSSARTAVSRLRKVLGGRLRTVAGGYRLELESDELDARRFEVARRRASTADDPERVELLTDALALWRGGALQDVADTVWASTAAASLGSARAAATEDLVESLIAVGRARDAVEILERHVAEHPYRERPAGQLMRALAASGRLAEALRSYQRFRVALRDDVGLEPTSELCALEASLLADADRAAAVSDAPPNSAVPVGTVTFVVTDVDGATDRWELDQAGMATVVSDHFRLLESIVNRHGGALIGRTASGAHAAFAAASSAVAAASDIHVTVSPPVRIGIHTCEVASESAPTIAAINRAERVMHAAHAGQTLVSSATAAVLDGRGLVDHGLHRLEGLAEPERLAQVGNEVFPPPRSLRVRPGNLPYDPTSFVGRGQDAGDLAALLTEHRTATLVGPGGVGKTRLALELAASLAPSFPDGCWFVDLSSVALAEDVAIAVAKGVGAAWTDHAEPVDAIVVRLRHRRALVVVDNCEHVTRSAADAMRRIRDECPSVTLLATSREPLMFPGERLLPVATLEPQAATQLFVERARTEAPGLDLDDGQMVAIATICERLDHLPLAIELAAAHSRTFSPIELLPALDGRLDLLAGGRRARHEHHATLRAAIDWSYERCSEDERACYEMLAIFAGAFDLRAVRSVATRAGVPELDVIDALPRLVDRSLVQRTTPAGAPSRYRLLETLRTYGREQLRANDRLDRMRSAHANYVRSELASTWSSSDVRSPPESFRRRDDLVADALAALDHLIERRAWADALWIPSVDSVVNGALFADLWARIADALAASGDVPAEWHEIVRTDHRSASSPTRHLELSWEAVRGLEPIPSDRPYRPPELSIELHSADEAVELLACLTRYDGAPVSTRFWAHLGAARAVVRYAEGAGTDPAQADGFIDALARLHDDVERSVHGRAFGRAALAMVRGDMSLAVGNWSEARARFEQVLSEDPGTRGWLHVIATWKAIWARIRAGETVPCSELVDAWDKLFDERQHVLRTLGATVTAGAMVANGEGELATRFAHWIHTHHPPDQVGSFEAMLGAVGVVLRPCAAPVADDRAELAELVDLIRAQARVD
jgi:predicted ATPase/DNA-binding SARP family transcriptional activator